MIRSLTIPLLLVCLMPVSRVLASDTAIQFRRDVLPLLSDRCFHCHGPDESHREAGLRLDLREHALAERDGGRAIVPGQPEKSELLLRIASGDDTLVMPPVDSHRKPLSPREIALVRQWIAEGAEWGRHWSFEKPVRPAVPDLARHPIDAFIRARLREAKLSPAPPAEPHVQLRRVTFDLTGLPPTREELDAFLANPTSDAYAAVVDRLLGSPHYGERMAMWWLDAARYSDTDGYQQDATRANWPWRDWVIQSFNDNKPYDQFTLEQFAGDLLPEATPEQILATCFHRNHMTNGEGGRDPEESRIDYVIDRVNTTGTVWLGLTLGCCQCHSHKFDPVSQHDYYSLFAFFNSIDEDGRAGGGAKPYLKYQSPRTAEVLADAQQLVETRPDRSRFSRGRNVHSNPGCRRAWRRSSVTLPPGIPCRPADWNPWRARSCCKRPITPFKPPVPSLVKTIIESPFARNWTGSREFAWRYCLIPRIPRESFPVAQAANSF
ncbi:MAG: DUF1549 domain-containing protein [Planctomycetaceae bacterium]